MDSRSINENSQIIELEDDIIDLDEAEKTPEEVIYEWDAKIRKKLSKFALADNENVLGDLMKEYLQSLEEMTRSYEDNETLKNKVYCHINFLYLYYVELHCCTPDNYLINMEDILTLYCNLELEVIRPLKRKDFSKHKYKKRIVLVATKIIHVLTVYLLEQHDHILHVLIKMNTNKVSDSCSEVLNILYTHFLTKVPALNLCDESFCRNYIVFQKWKEIRKVEDWEGMDKIMYTMFKRTPESIKTNETLRQILMPACSSTVDIVMNLFRSFRAITKAYFNHVSAKKNIDVDDLDFNIDLGEDEPTIPLDDDNEEVQFLKAYYEAERNMSNLSHAINTSEMPEIDIFRKCKEEFDEDDDVQFIGITVLSKPPLLNLTENDENECRMSNESSQSHPEPERIPIPSTPLPVRCTEKTSDLENLNGMSRICIGSPRTVSETSPSSEATLDKQSVIQPTPLPSSVETVTAAPEVEPEINQPEVPFVSNTTEIQSPPSPEKTTESENRQILVEMKSVEVQPEIAKNYVYNDYGLTTPPFDITTDEQAPRAVEPRLYATIGKKEAEKAKNALTQSVEIQVEAQGNCPYNDYGLTPPNDTHLEDHNTRLQEPLYMNIGQKDLNSDSTQVNTHNSEIPQVAQESAELETDLLTKNTDAAHESEFDEFEDQLDISEMSNVADYDEEIDVESCTEPVKSPLIREDSQSVEIPINPHIQVPESSLSDFKKSDQIDTGQKSILNSAPNIVPVTAESEIKDLPNEIYNGGTILKPLVTSNRTNGAKDSTSTKIMYTSSQRIRPTLDEFSRFENAINNQWNKAKENHDFDEIMSGPVSKVLPIKQNSLFSSQDIFSQESNSKVNNANSRSSSPNEMISPAYEAIDDFRNYFSDSVNGRVPPPCDVKVPPGILKKNKTVKRKNFRIMFHESTCDNSEERKPRRDGVLVPKSVRKDKKLNMEPRIVLDRLSMIENAMKKVMQNNPRTVRIDYDKTSTQLNAKDVVRYASPPPLTWKVNHTTNKRSSGSMTVKNREHLEKKPKKRKFESQPNSLGEPVIRKRGRPRKNL